MKLCSRYLTMGVLMMVSTLYFWQCKDDAKPHAQAYPIIETQSVSNIDSSGVVFNGRLLQSGIDPVVDYGFVWGKSPKPTINNFRIALGKDLTSTFSTRVGFDLIAGNTYYARTYLITPHAQVYGSDVTFTSKGSAKPTLTSFSPTDVIDGDTISITGLNFSSSTAENKVMIGIANASVVSASNKLIKAVVPAIAAAGPVKITVTTNGKSMISTSTVMIHSPEVTTFSPTRGPDGTQVTINGNYFSYRQDFNKVTIGDFIASVISASRKQLKVMTPFSSFSGNSSIVVSVNGKSTASIDQFFVNGPYVAQVAPLQGSYQDVITLTGEGFSSVLTDNKVKFGGLTATVTSASATQLTVLAPDLAAESVLISVSVGNKTNQYATPFVAINSWKRGADFPGGVRGMATSFTIGNSGYVATGRENSYDLFVSSSNSAIYKDLWEFNASSNSWTKRADLPGPARYYAMSFVIGSKAYVGGGIPNFGNFLSDFYEYNPATNTWRQIASLPGNGRYAGVGFSANGKGYIGLGIGDSGTKNDFFEYNPATDTWAQFSGFGLASSTNVAFNINDKGYVVAAQQVWKLNETNLTWTRLADYPDNAFGSFVFTLNNKAYVGSGLYSAFSTLIYSRNVYEYDPTNNNWLIKPGFQYLKRFTGAAFGINNKAYVTAGQSNAVTDDSWPYRYVNDLWIFEPGN
jgi:N-acetylneuraminic acid mutarotase